MPSRKPAKKNQDKPRAEKPQPRKQGRDSKPVRMSGLTGPASEGSQLGNPTAQDVGTVGSSGMGEIQFENPDRNTQHNPDTEEGLDEQVRDGS